MRKILLTTLLLAGSALADTSQDYWIISETSSSPTTTLVEQKTLKSTAPLGAVARATPHSDQIRRGYYGDIYSEHVTKVKNTTKVLQYYGFKYKHDIDRLDHHEKIERRIGLKPGGTYIKNDIMRSATGSNQSGQYKFEASTRIVGESADYNQDSAMITIV
jgi:hypothetical protein